MKKIGCGIGEEAGLEKKEKKKNKSTAVSSHSTLTWKQSQLGKGLDLRASALPFLFPLSRWESSEYCCRCRPRL